MRLHKKTVWFAIAIIAVLSLIGGGAFFSIKMMNVWDDESTWSVDSSVALPVVADGTFKMTSEKNDSGGTTITVPFCVLYDAAEVENGATEYYCAAIPYSTLQLIDYFPTSFQFKKDIVFTYNPERDPLPEEFIGRLGITSETIKSIGSEPLPVSMEAEVSHTKPKLTPVSLVTHYLMVMRGEKEVYEATAMESWKISKVKLAADYSEAEKKEVVAEWRKQAWQDINKLLKTEEYLNAPNNKELVTKLGPAMAWRSVYCPTAEVAEQCEVSYPQNASTNIMYYVYAASRIDERVAKQMTLALREKVIPFVFDNNPDMATYYGNCDPEGECAYYHNMQVYDYPVCPINHLASARKSTYIEELYEELRFVLIDDEFIEEPLNYAEIEREINALKQDFLKSGIYRAFNSYEVGEAISKIDKLCLHMVYNQTLPDQRLVAMMKEIYYLYVFGQVFTDEQDFNITPDKVDEKLFQLVLNAGVLNPYAYSIVPQPYTSYHRILTGVYKADADYLLDGYWGSINMTLVLLYLTSSY
ncbi:MAG: hypothetical protein QY312_03870 [Candidatus Dojkabacteria bacterium]|nr:MAG: hypothetical protein QY312_03870 [Candidatus Dojkabacteria bacterium]